MAEAAAAFGIVTGVVGLLPICGKGCDFIKSIVKAHHHAEEQLIRIQMQQWDLDAWARVWDVPPIVPKQRTDSKLQRFIDRDHDRGYKMLKTLAVISNMFADARDLETKYGIHLKHRDQALRHLTDEKILIDRRNVDQIQRRMDSRRQHMSILRRCRFQLEGTAKFDTFIERLKEFIATLRNICSEIQAIQLERSLPDHVSGNRDPESLEAVSRVYGEEVERRRKAGQHTQGPELIRDIAAFKARAQQLVRRRHTALQQREKLSQKKSFLLSGDYLKVADFDFKEGSNDSSSTKITVAKDKGTQKTCYIEWKPYAYEVITETNDYDFRTNRRKDKKAEDDIMALSDFFNVEDRPAAFRILPFQGIFRDDQRERFGLVYAHPKNIEDLEGNRSVQNEVANSRIPISLLEQLKKDSQSSKPLVWPLGDRFKLASTVAQCLYVLHAAGWVHKNVRSSSFIFFPHSSSSGPSTNSAKSISKPYLCGFGHSRPGQQDPSKEDPHSKGIPSRSKTYWNITLDEYHHPAKRVNSSLEYTQAFDLYSLGVVLLEIGLWQPLSSLSATMNLTNDPHVFHEHLLKIAQQELPGQVGKIYADVVLACLKVSSGESDSKVQDLLCWKVAAALDGCNA